MDIGDWWEREMNDMSVCDVGICEEITYTMKCNYVYLECSNSIIPLYIR